MCGYFHSISLIFFCSLSLSFFFPIISDIPSNIHLYISTGRGVRRHIIIYLFYAGLASICSIDHKRRLRVYLSHSTYTADDESYLKAYMYSINREQVR